MKSTKRKLRAFQIMKFSSPRLKDEQYNIKTSLSQARANDEVIKIGENELTSTIKRVSDKPIDFSRVEEIEGEIKRISKLRNSDSNREHLKLLREELDEITFVPELVSIQFADTRHYDNILKQGLFINGVEYVRILAGAGNIRRNTVMFLAKTMYEDVTYILDNGRDKSVHLNPAKLSAYFGLYGSAGHSVSTPRVSVIPDCEIARPATIDWVDEQDKVEKVDMTVELNITDGQGLISPEYAKTWGDELGLEHIPATFIFRAPFIKGLLATFDFHEFARRNDKVFGTDIWGNQFVIADQDVILSESQFKMASSYASSQEFLSKMNERGLGVRVLRYSPEVLPSHTSTNYMILQVLNLDDGDIEKLCKDTLEYFQDVEIDDEKKTALYLSGGRSFPPEFSSDDFNRLDIVSRAILAFPTLLKENYISQRILGTLKKRESQAKLGKLILEGNYSIIVSDPYAQSEHLCGMEVKGLLADDEHYSSFWNERGVNSVACARSPLTHQSELRTGKLVSGGSREYWYKYLEDAFILPSMGLDTIYFSDSDFDGDILLTTSKTELMNCRIDGVPISYEHGGANKKLVTQEDIYVGDKEGMNTKIGFITNLSSSYHAMLYLFDEGSPEYNEIQRRLKLLRMLQGENIDSAKNAGKTRKVPSHWTRWDKDSSPLDKALVADKRPLFTIHLYDSYMKRYKDELKNYDKHSWNRFGKSFDEILASTSRTDDEKILVERYYRNSFFIFSPSPMNRISKYMTEELEKIHSGISKESAEFDYEMLFSSKDIKVDPVLLDKMKILFVKYSSAKKAWRNKQNEYMKKDIFYILSMIGTDARQDVSSSGVELADLAVQLMIEDSRTRSFAWTVFGDYIVENILNRHGRQIDVLIRDDFGDVEFLFEKYSKRRIMV